MGKCIKCLDALHWIEPCSYIHSFMHSDTYLANCSNPASLASYSVALTSIIPSTQIELIAAVQNLK